MLTAQNIYPLNRSFYINLPIGGLALALIALLVPLRPPYGRSDSYKGYGRHMLKQLAQCDWVGVAIVLAWGTVSILVMQEGVSRLERASVLFLGRQ